mmetsp:Transcript_54687/g.119872  ORF Transcript_54687/g.119872 Transcript_54687/m.119872 type:complete len:215 (+) Transcript_54687:480-1124(+)
MMSVEDSLGTGWPASSDGGETRLGLLAAAPPTTSMWMALAMVLAKGTCTSHLTPTPVIWPPVATATNMPSKAVTWLATMVGAVGPLPPFWDPSNLRTCIHQKPIQRSIARARRAFRRSMALWALECTFSASQAPMQGSSPKAMTMRHTNHISTAVRSTRTKRMGTRQNSAKRSSARRQAQPRQPRRSSSRSCEMAQKAASAESSGSPAITAALP